MRSVQPEQVLDVRLWADLLREGTGKRDERPASAIRRRP